MDWCVWEVQVKLVRFYCSPINVGTVRLVGAEAHHLAAVRRLGAGDVVELFDGQGAWARGRIVAVGRREVELQVLEVQRVAARVAGRVVIAASVAKGERFEWMLSKCTELGVDAIWPVVFERTVKLAKGAKVVRRWEKLAIEAAKQCGRAWLPAIETVAGLGECLERRERNYSGSKVLYGSADRGTPPIATVAAGGADVIALVGPEGGITDEEVAMLRAAGGQAVRLGDTVLRVETAGVALAAVLVAQRSMGGG